MYDMSDGHSIMIKYGEVSEVEQSCLSLEEALQIVYLLQEEIYTDNPKSDVKVYILTPDGQCLDPQAALY